MEAFYDRLVVRAATIDELLSDDFESLPGQKADADIAARRIAAWCRSCAGGDWEMFERRLKRDGFSIAQVLAKFATVRRKVFAPTPPWITDLIWIEAALTDPAPNVGDIIVDQPGIHAFEHLFASVIAQADARLWANTTASSFMDSARACLRHQLLKQLSDLCGAALYQRYTKTKNSVPSISAESGQGGRQQYTRFIAELKVGGIRSLFDEKPVLARLIAITTRQWIDTSRDFITRLEADLPKIRSDLLHANSHSDVSTIESGLSDLHNAGHSVQIATFEDGSRVVYKPKDLELDAVWHDVVEQLNLAGAPIQLKAARVITQKGYGWSEFVAHRGCDNQEGVELFFQRAGAWLMLFHCFVARDMHQENIIADADHPIPIDIEVIFQGNAREQEHLDAEVKAFRAAVEAIDNSVSVVGLLPTYGRSADNRIFGTGGLNSEPVSTWEAGWKDINSDFMRPIKLKKANNILPNLPHVGGHYVNFRDHVDDFIDGFDRYGQFLIQSNTEARLEKLIAGFAGLQVRKIIRPTQFYYMLLLRLKNHSSMGDGVEWSTQADFISRLADWSSDGDNSWPLVQAERAAILQLNVPLLTSLSDGNEVSDKSGISARMSATSGMERVQSRLQNLNTNDIDWQIKIIRENTNSISGPTPSIASGSKAERWDHTLGLPLDRDELLAEVREMVDEISLQAIRRGPGAAWIGRDYLGDSEVAQLAPLGPGMYNGTSGLAIFLAAHAAVTGHQPSGELALAGIAHLRNNLHGLNSASTARLLGIGGATGLGSIVYALTVTSSLLGNNKLLADAVVASELFTRDLIAADRELDVIGGAAGGILGLLRLHRETGSEDVLNRATECGDHLLGQRRVGTGELKSWSGESSGPRPLNGMAHGAAGFAYALASLSAATGREDFSEAAEQCIAYENSSFDQGRSNWPDLRDPTGASWPCQWCHGAYGIGIARIAAARRGGLRYKRMLIDVEKAIVGVERGGSRAVDTLCCGTLGGIEFLCEASAALERTELRDQALRRLAGIMKVAAKNGDYRWNSGSRQFNLGLFRGLAGVGYTLLRQVDASLPNVLFWQ